MLPHTCIHTVSRSAATCAMTQVAVPTRAQTHVWQREKSVQHRRKNLARHGNLRLLVNQQLRHALESQSNIEASTLSVQAALQSKMGTVLRQIFYSTPR
jgi:hypothetical protein